MNVDVILEALRDAEVDYLLIGGMNFLLRHLPELTFDVDIWVHDQPENLARLNLALKKLSAQWGRTVAEWKPVPEDWRWLQAQGVFCLTTQHGAVDVFRDVCGLEGQYAACRQRAVSSKTAAGRFSACRMKTCSGARKRCPQTSANPGAWLSCARLLIGGRGIDESGRY